MLQHQSGVTVRHDATGFEFPPMRTRTGGAREGDNQLIRPGNMAKAKAFEGPSEYGEVTCGCLLEHEIHSGLTQKADGWHGDRFTITEVHKDARGRPGFHRPDAWSGLLNTSTPPEYDADGTDPKVLELAFTIDGRV